MTTDQIAVRDEPVAAKPRDNRRRTRSPKVRGWGWLGMILVVLAVGGVGGLWLMASRNQQAKDGEKGSASDEGHEKKNLAKVQVIEPERGGMERVMSQPGTIRAFEFAPLYTKVSGFIKTLNVDRGSRVKKGDLLAEIYDPERDVAVIQAEASLEHSKAEVAQAKASILTAEASVKAAKAKQNEAKATLDQQLAARDYRNKAYQRISELVARGSAEQRLKDEYLDEWHSAEAAVLSAQAGIETAAALLFEAQAKVEKAKADFKSAEAKVQVAAANLQMAKVFVQYTRIESPYDGVVIFRGEAVHPGSFVRAADQGGVNTPLLTVAMTEKMRTIVPVPDRDVPYCQVGDPATVTLDAFPGKVFHGKVDRTAESETLDDRLMRVEIDLPNPDGLLRDGMFCRADIILEKVVKNLTVPSSCLINRNGKGEGAVLVVRDGKIHRVNVHVGMDTGLRAEIVDGLTDNDQVIVQPDPSIAEGTPVQVESAGSRSSATDPKKGE
ncbi:MAG TPA: efflux RND transporter periplasmic adaptor subunit [Isosphaeraceae bacterium]|nr:efflux RND transporter periplasmic adaptor subunit [Isosphaeraceae bacterium]